MHNFSKDNRPGGTYVMRGKEVSRVGYGTMQLPKLKDEAKAKEIIRKAYELGVNHFDTADFYEDGFTNRCLADEIGKKQDAVIVTKIGAKPGKGIMPMLPAQRPEELRQQIEDNLRSLKTDHLGIVNFRRIAPGTFPLKPGEKVNFDDQIAELIKLRDEGKIEAIGLSTVSLEELKRALPIGIACVQNQYNITSRRQESILNLCRKEGDCMGSVFSTWRRLAWFRQGNRRRNSTNGSKRDGADAGPGRTRMDSAACRKCTYHSRNDIY